VLISCVKGYFQADNAGDIDVCNDRWDTWLPKFERKPMEIVVKG